MILLKKIHGNIMFSSNVLKDDLFPKKIALEYDFSCCIIWKDDISFSRKYDFIRKTENERKPFSKKYMEI